MLRRLGAGLSYSPAAVIGCSIQAVAQRSIEASTALMFWCGMLFINACYLLLRQSFTGHEREPLDLLGQLIKASQLQVRHTSCCFIYNTLLKLCVESFIILKFVVVAVVIQSDFHLSTPTRKTESSGGASVGLHQWPAARPSR